MNMKIGHGLRLAAGVDPFTLPALLTATLSPVRDRLDAEEVTRRAVARHDLSLLGLPLGPMDDRFGARTALWAAYGEFRHDQGRYGEHETWHDPHRFDLWVGRLGRRHLVLPMEMGHVYRDVLLGLPEFEDYGYWNHIDRPDNLTGAQWARRGRDWETVWPGHLRESMWHYSLRTGPFDGMPWGLASDNDEPLYKAVFASLDTTRPTRARTIAVDRVAGALLKREHERGEDLDFGLVRDAGYAAREAEPVIAAVADLLPTLRVGFLHQPVPVGDHLADLDAVVADWVADHPVIRR